MPTRSRADGQASAEYVALLALLAVVLAGAATVVAAPDLPAAVVRHLKVAVCIAGGDVCRSADAAARGLEPCVRSSSGRSRDSGVDIGGVFSGHDRGLEIERRSDGIVVVRGTDGGRMGVGVLFAEGGIDFQRGREWHFPGEAAARAFLDRIHDDLRLTDDADVHRVTGSRAPIRYLEGGARLAAELAIELGGPRGGIELPGLGRAEMRKAVGRRLAPDGTTLYYELDEETSGPLAEALGAAGRSSWVAEWHHREPHDVLTLRASGAARAGRRTEHVATLPLGRPDDRRAALAAVVADATGPLGDGAMRALLGRITERGSLERRTYEERRETRTIGVGGRVLHIGLGFEHERVRVERRLVAAEVLAGGRTVSRSDCLGGA